MTEGNGRLQGKVAAITGGSTGIGRGIAELFVREGASVALMARRAAQLETAVAALRPPDHALGVIGDVGSTEEPHMAAYNASKAALVLLARSMAVDLAADGIRVNVVAPGTIATEITRPMLEAGFGFGTVPLGRIGEPIDTAWPVLWLASDEAAYITGATIVVDGGQIALNGDLPPRSPRQATGFRDRSAHEA